MHPRGASVRVTDAFLRTGISYFCRQSLMLHRLCAYPRCNCRCHREFDGWHFRPGKWKGMREIPWTSTEHD
jgi:hypothetical protein